MNVYDFDETIYAGDSTKDFVFFLYKRHPRLLRYLPKQAQAFMAYSNASMTKTEFKAQFYSMFQAVPDIDEELARFWAKAGDRIYPYYLKQQRPDDLVISASPEFLLEPIAERLGISHFLGSRICRFSGVSTGENCHGAEKVHRFLAAGYDPDEVEAFYSDSCTDFPLAELAEEAYIVQDGIPGPWERPTKKGLSAFFQLFNDRNFLLLLIAGLLNVFLVFLLGSFFQIFTVFGLALIGAGMMAPLVARIVYILSHGGPIYEKGVRRRLAFQAFITAALSYGVHKVLGRSKPLSMLFGLSGGLGSIYLWARRVRKRRFP